MTRFLLLVTITVVGCAPRPQPPTTRPTDSGAPQPYHSARSQVADYFGPGREDPPPPNLPEVKIGWFGPSDPNHPAAGLMWLAATLAVEEANQAGGYDGSPFRLVPVWSENPWDTGVAGVTRLAYEGGVWAIAGAPDGPSAHLVAQVVAKARLTFLNPVSCDPTTNLANVPWVFSCAPSYRIQAAALADALLSRSAGGRFVLVSAIDHDSRVASAELLAALDQRGSFPALHLQFRTGSADFDELARTVRDANLAAVALLAGPQDGARFLRVLRQSGWDGQVLGGPALASRTFIESAGVAADGVVFPLLWDSAGVAGPALSFSGRFRDQFGRAPDYTAAYTYDALRLLIAAIRQAGLNRALIRDAVRSLSPWAGTTGTMEWNAVGQSESAVELGTIKAGQVLPLTHAARGPLEEASSR